LAAHSTETEPESAKEAEDEPVRIPYYCREYSIFTCWGKIYQVIDGSAVLMKDRKGNPFSGKEAEKISSFVAIKEKLNDLIGRQLNPRATDSEVEFCRIQLKLLYQAHVAKFGILSNKITHKYCVEDPEYLKVAAIETCRKVTETNKAGIKVLEAYDPIWFIAENVSGISKIEAGEQFKTILRDLANAGKGQKEEIRFAPRKTRFVRLAADRRSSWNGCAVREFRIFEK